MLETIKYGLWKYKRAPCRSFLLLSISYTRVWYVRYFPIPQNIY